MKVVVWFVGFILLSGWCYSNTHEEYYALTEQHYAQNPDSCIHYATLALASTSDTRELADTQYYLAAAHAKVNELPKAAIHYLKALTLFRKLDDDKKISDLMLDLGSVFRRCYAYDKAIAIYQESALIKAEINDTNLLAGCYRNIAKVYRLKGEYDSAMLYNDRALSIYMESDNTSRVARVLNEIGIVYYETGEYAKAIELYFQALEVDTKRKAQTFNNVGNAYLKLENYTKSKSYFLRAMELKKGLNIHTTANNLAKLYLHEQQVDSALHYLSVVKNYPTGHELLITHELMVKCYDQLGMHNERGEMLNDLLAMNTELVNMTKNNDRLYSFYELERALYQYQKEERKKVTFWKNMALISLGIAIVILVIFQTFRRWSFRREKRSIINDLEKLI